MKMKGLGLAIAMAALFAGAAFAQQAPSSIKIGYALSLSGVNAQGAAVTTLPGYKLWVDDVNKKGGVHRAVHSPRSRHDSSRVGDSTPRSS